MVGKKYLIKHQRKGKFTVFITKQCETWTTGIIVDGISNAILPENIHVQGEEVTLRTSFCVFEEIKS